MGTQQEKLSIPREAKVKVYWEDLPENYSKNDKSLIKDRFAKKYGVSKPNIQVIYKAIKREEDGTVIEIDGATIDNIMDKNYQKSLMKEWVIRENKDVDFNRLMDLDNKVNSKLDSEFLEHRSNKRWSIKWLMIDNFLPFGSENYVPLANLNGLVIVNSIPANQGGKTSFTVDAFKFLIFGTTTKTDKNEQIFNQYSGVDELVIRGMVVLDDDDEEIIIQRKLNRKAKRKGGWSVTNVVEYYNLLPDGTEVIQVEADAIKTTKKIKETIGLEDDFELVVLATARNIDDLIDQTSGESGKMLTRFIGLEVISVKEGIVRKMHNEFTKKMRSNTYDSGTLQNEIVEHEETIVGLQQIKLNSEAQLVVSKTNHDIKVTEKEDLIKSKIKIDVEITALNPSNLKIQKTNLTTESDRVKKQIEDLNLGIGNCDEILFDEERHIEVNNEINAINLKIGIEEVNITTIRSTIQMLKDGQICNTCNRALDNVNNTQEINKNNNKIVELKSVIHAMGEELNLLNTELGELNKVKIRYDEKNKMELKRDRAQVESDSLHNDIKSVLADLQKYQDNLDGIESNRDIDSKIQIVRCEIDVLTYEKEGLLSKIQKVQNDIDNNENDIKRKKGIIIEISTESEIDKLFKIYVEMIGKKGITKLVLRSVLPILNSEVQRLLDDICDFEIEIYMDDKNDVRYLLVKDGVEKPLKSASGLERTISSLAIRVVLGKMSALPMPNFITFDEVLGRVASENVLKMEPLFNKIKDMYDIVFFITHDEMVKDWGDSIITVKKTNNISKIHMS